MVMQKNVTHVALVLDKSSSMWKKQRDVIKAADAQIEHLAKRAKDLGQEIRVSVYAFADQVECLLFNLDVNQLPTTADLYHVGGNTALRDATLKSIDDLERADELERTASIYGDHAFLVIVMTDGEENVSRNSTAALRSKLQSLPANWTVACMVPNMMGKDDARSFGFPPENIAIWDTDARYGVEDAGRVIREATDDFLEGRSRGVRGTRSFFSTGADAVNRQTVRSSLVPLDPRTYHVLPVTRRSTIRDYIESRQVPYATGKAYYQFTKRETIQGGKEFLIREKATGEVYAGREARELMGLNRTDIRDKPTHNEDYDVFVQSTSPVRVLVPETDVIVLR